MAIKGESSQAVNPQLAKVAKPQDHADKAIRRLPIDSVRRRYFEFESDGFDLVESARLNHVSVESLAMQLTCMQWSVFFPFG